MRILGISAFYHDSAAALVDDGRIVAAAQEERFSRKKHDARLPRHAIEYCLAEGGVEPRPGRPRRLLRQALPEVRAAPGDLPGLRAARVPVVLDGRPPVGQGKALPEAPPQAGARRPRGRDRGEAAVRRAPSEPRGERLLPLAVRRGGHPHHGRGGRMGDDLGGRGPRELPGDREGDPLPTLAGASLLGLHVLHGLQGQLRRVQAHGARPLRRAEVRPASSSTGSSISSPTAPSASTSATSTTAPGSA